MHFRPSFLVVKCCDYQSSFDESLREQTQEAKDTFSGRSNNSASSLSLSVWNCLFNEEPMETPSRAT